MKEFDISYRFKDNDPLHCFKWAHDQKEAEKIFRKGLRQGARYEIISINEKPDRRKDEAGS